MTATTPPSSSGATGTAPPWPAPRSGQRRARATLAALSIAAVCAVVTAGASRETSTTFDEIVLMAGGARGYEEGAWDLAPEHPPLMQYLYGLPIWLSRPNFPERVTAPPREVRDFAGAGAGCATHPHRGVTGRAGIRSQPLGYTECVSGAVRGPSYYRKGWADSRTRLFSGRLRAPSVAR